jgi:hypothetical protein
MDVMLSASRGGAKHPYVFLLRAVPGFSIENLPLHFEHMRCWDASLHHPSRRKGQRLPGPRLALSMTIRNWIANSKLALRTNNEELITANQKFPANPSLPLQ